MKKKKKKKKKKIPVVSFLRSWAFSFMHHRLVVDKRARTLAHSHLSLTHSLAHSLTLSLPRTRFVHPTHRGRMDRIRFRQLKEMADADKAAAERRRKAEEKAE